MLVNTPAAVAARYDAYRRKPPTATARYNRAEPTPAPSSAEGTEAQEPSARDRPTATHFHPAGPRRARPSRRLPRISDATAVPERLTEPAQEEKPDGCARRAAAGETGHRMRQSSQSS
ncbi:hypothetical protein GCM10010247_33520 [Streptomyces calvus]|nr:hypothetical protein GCM10010247_33520 [Streptomyces calvus]